MSVNVTYKDETLVEFSSSTKVLKTAGKYLEDDVTIEDEGSSIALVKEYMQSSGGISVDITSAGAASLSVVDTLDSAGGTIRNITADLVVNLQTKTVVPSSSAITVSPDSGYDGLSECIVTPPSAPYLIPTGTATISENGTVDISEYEYVSVTVVPSGFNLQAKTATPSTAVQTIIADTGYDALSSVEVGAIPSDFVGTAIARRTAGDLAAIGSSISVISGYYEFDVLASVAAGSVGAPSIAKSAVSNHTITLTPSVTTTSGFIEGSTITGNTATVSASEVVGGNKIIVNNGTNIDVTNYQTVNVNIEDIGSVSQDSAGYVVLANTGTRYNIGLSREDTQIGNILNLFYALEHGVATTGEFTLSSALPASETLVLSTGLSVLSGFFIAAETQSSYTANSTPENILFSILFWDTDGNEKYACTRINVKLNSTGTSGNTSARFLARCSYRWDEGKLYCKADFGGNNNYTPFHSGIKYRWVAW